MQPSIGDHGRIFRLVRHRVVAMNTNDDWVCNVACSADCACNRPESPDVVDDDDDEMVGVMQSAPSPPPRGVRPTTLLARGARILPAVFGAIANVVFPEGTALCGEAATWLFLLYHNKTPPPWQPAGIDIWCPRTAFPETVARIVTAHATDEDEDSDDDSTELEIRVATTGWSVMIQSTSFAVPLYVHALKPGETAETVCHDHPTSVTRIGYNLVDDTLMNERSWQEGPHVFAMCSADQFGDIVAPWINRAYTVLVRPSSTPIPYVRPSQPTRMYTTTLPPSTAPDDVRYILHNWATPNVIMRVPNHPLQRSMQATAVSMLSREQQAHCALLASLREMPSPPTTEIPRQHQPCTQPGERDMPVEMPTSSRLSSFFYPDSS